MSIPRTLADFTEIWCCDFEFGIIPGNRPWTICMVAREFRTQRVIRLWVEELRQRKAAPFAVGRDSLFVAYYASAEIGCFLALGWPLPTFVLDLYAEFRTLANGLTVPCGRGLVGALTWFGLDSIGADEKEDMRALALRGGPWTGEEKTALLDYCQSDVDALVRLLPRMEPHLDLARALLRGRYMKAIAHMEHAGVPIDTTTWRTLVENWQAVQAQLIRAQDSHGVYDGLTFKSERWVALMERLGIPWPRLESGNLSLDDETFKQMAHHYPVVRQYRELRNTLSQLRLNNFTVGPDGRNRCLLSPFGARTGRNTPSNSRFIFGPSAWLRGLIKPECGRAVAYLDYSQQEFAIAAALSHDPAMLAAYAAGDVYLSFAKQAGAIPTWATKATHRETRDLFKQCILATQYGQEAASLAIRIGKSAYEAKELLQLHRATYKGFWAWSDGIEAYALQYGELRTVFGWKFMLETGKKPNLRSLRNFPVQGNGAEMLRLACSLTIERGVTVVAPVHDALMIEAGADEMAHAVSITRQAMIDASAAVLAGFQIRSDVKVTRYPDRYQDERGADMWARVIGLLPRPIPPIMTVYPTNHDGLTYHL